MQIFNLGAGFTELRNKGELPKAYLAIVLGIALHWIWEVLVKAVQSGHIDFGSWVIVVARLGLAFIVGLVIFVGVWKQLETVDTKLRFFFAVTQGFATDALASPIANAANA